ncbi:MAG: hypothetical protein ACPF9D_07465 [Owenweeksia sp.]
MRNKKINNKRQLDEYIRELRLEKEIQKQKLLADVEVMKHSISSIEAGIQAFQTVMRVFKNSGQNGIDPKDRLRNMAINMGIDILSDVLTHKMDSASESAAETKE